VGAVEDERVVDVEDVAAFLTTALGDVPHAASVRATADKQRIEPAVLNRLTMR
jgi:hypothetical protein